MSDNKKLCFGCEYYYITWDQKFPKGCKGFGFKTRRIPCDDVLESSGEQCKMYIPKQKNFKNK